MNKATSERARLPQRDVEEHLCRHVEEYHAFPFLSFAFLVVFFGAEFRWDYTRYVALFLPFSSHPWLVSPWPNSGWWIIL